MDLYCFWGFPSVIQDGDLGLTCATNNSFWRKRLEPLDWNNPCLRVRFPGGRLGDERSHASCFNKEVLLGKSCKGLNRTGEGDVVVGLQRWLLSISSLSVCTHHATHHDGVLFSTSQSWPSNLPWITDVAEVALSQFQVYSLRDIATSYP